MQHDSEFTPLSNSTNKGSATAAKSKRSLPMHSSSERPRQHSFVQQTPADSPTCSAGGACVTTAQQDGEKQSSNGSTLASHGRTMSWLPFPAMNADVSWTDLTDSDEDDAGHCPPVGAVDTTPVQDPVLHNDGTMPVSGPLIPSFSGDLDPVDTSKVTEAVGGALHSDLSTISFGRLESPTPVAVIQDMAGVSKQPSRTQFGFALGTSAAPRSMPGVADALLDVAGTEAGSVPASSCWRSLNNGSPDSVPDAEFEIEPKLEAVNPVSRDERVLSMIEAAKQGLSAGCPPNAPREGMGGTYFLSSDSGRYVGIFKPCDEEPLAPNNPKGWNSRAMSDPGMKPSVRVGEAALREVAAFLLDHDGFAGVPPACLVAVSHQKLNYAVLPAAPVPSDTAAVPIPTLSPLNGADLHESLHASEGSADSSDSPVSTPADTRLTAPAVPGSVKLGSLQAFAEHTCDANDIASSRFSADSIHRVGILDVRLLNLDRHAGNLLVAEAPRSGSVSGGPGPLHKLIPIDHGFALPEALDDPYFEWQYWPQASVPFSPEVKAYVAALDGSADVAMLQRELPALRPECLRCLLVTTTVLKRCVAANMTLAEIAGIFTRAKASEASDFEAICMDAREDALAHSALPSLPSLTISDFPMLTRDQTSGHPSACLGPFQFDEASGELSPQSSLAMSGLIGNGLASGTVSCETSPFKPLPADVVSEVPLEGGEHAAESPCMLAASAATALQCTTPAAGTALPAIPSTPSWLCTAELGPYSPHSPTLVAPNSVCFAPPQCSSDDPAAADIRRSEQGMSMGGFGCHLSAHSNIASRTVWHSKRRGRNGSNLPNLLSAVHPDKANYVFSKLSECQWSVFLGRVEDFVDEELMKGTWNAPECAGPVAGSCPEPVKNRKF